MKRIISSLFLVLSIIAFSACSKSSGGLSGTKWTTTFSGDRYVLEFTSASDARIYKADDNLNYVEYLRQGTYSKNNGTITFQDENIFLGDMKGIVFVEYYYFTSGTISGDTISISTRGSRLKVSFDGPSTEREDIPGKSFTFLKAN